MEIAPDFSVSCVSFPIRFSDESALRAGGMPAGAGLAFESIFSGRELAICLHFSGFCVEREGSWGAKCQLGSSGAPWALPLPLAMALCTSLNSVDCLN